MVMSTVDVLALSQRFEAQTASPRLEAQTASASKHVQNHDDWNLSIFSCVI
jgi:hypothetical protein